MEICFGERKEKTKEKVGDLNPNQIRKKRSYLGESRLCGCEVEKSRSGWQRA
jgi:hypothetical protein